MSIKMSQCDALKALFEEKKEGIYSDLETLLRFKSISTLPEYSEEVRACAHWLQEYLQAIDFEVELWETEGHPILFASHMKAGGDKPTLLIYHHYDVQPVDPIEEWKTPPFEPTICDNTIYARGAQDNKGQCMCVLAALKAMVQRDGTLPVNIKICIEGEEEDGSTGLLEEAFKREKELAADYLAVVDLTMKGAEEPSISLGIRGLLIMEVEAIGSSTDLHSGAHGGIVYNPNHALVELLAKARGASGRVMIPGFYDEVEAADEEMKEALALNFDSEEYRKLFGAEASGGGRGFFSSGVKLVATYTGN
jgi:acetylornithine deacetylase/succinyl-diaminopimelate desuccinylase-like protein